MHLIRLLRTGHRDHVLSIVVEPFPVTAFFAETSVVHSHLRFQGGFSGPSFTTLTESDLAHHIKGA